MLVSYTNDKNLLYADKDLKSLETIVNAELKNVCNWLNAYKLTINAKKKNQILLSLDHDKKELITRHVSEFGIITIMGSYFLNAKIM